MIKTKILDRQSSAGDKYLAIELKYYEGKDFDLPIVKSCLIGYMESMLKHNAANYSFIICDEFTEKERIEILRKGNLYGVIYSRYYDHNNL